MRMKMRFWITEVKVKFPNRMSSSRWRRSNDWRGFATIQTCTKGKRTSSFKVLFSSVLPDYYFVGFMTCRLKARNGLL
jgi:hypothetical protein